MAKTKKVSIIVHSDTMDKLYPVFMISSAGTAMDTEVHLFFTFWGLNMLRKGALDSAKLPGAMSEGTEMMKNKMKEIGVPKLTELLHMCKDTGNLKVYACSTTMEIMGVNKEDLIPEVDDILGATAFLDIAMDSEVQLFI
jgi:peroxiredoxin family protein